MKNRFFSLLLIGILTAGLSTSQVLADNESINFEGYSIGSVNGQDGWNSTGPYDHKVVDPHDFGYTTFGNRSLRISNAVTSGSFGDQTFSKPLLDEAGETDALANGLSAGTRQQHFEAQWDFASTVPNAEQSGLSVVASPDRGDGARMSWVQMTDTPTGLAVNFYDVQGTDNPANFVGPTPVVGGLDRTIPHTIKITMDFIDGPSNDVVKIYVDGNLLHTGTSWENYYVFDPESQAEGIASRTVDSILFRTGSTSVPTTVGKGFLIDNLILYSGPIPPPQCTTVCYVDVVNGSDANGGASMADAKATIQAAVNQVSAGGTVYVAPGTYYESNITVNKSMNVQGVPGDSSAGPGPNAPVIDGGFAVGDAFLLANGVSNVTIQGFEMRNYAPHPTGAGVGNGISAWEASTSNITIQDNYFHDLGWNGVLVGNDGALGDHTNWLIKNNIVEDYTAYGLELTNASNSSIENNIVHANNSWTNILIVARRNESGITIKNNLMDGSIDDTVGGSGRATIYILGWGFETPGAQLNSVTVKNNQISTTGAKPHILLYGAATGQVTGVTVTDNSFSTLKNVAAQADASANWWGDLDPSDNITGTGAVDYTPWLNVGIDISGDPGFQGDFSYLNVDDNSPQTGSAGRIQEGIDKTGAHGTVLVKAGTYVEQVVVNKSLTLFGESGADTTTIKAPATIPVAANPDSTIVKIAGSDVSVVMSGFTVAGPGPSGCGSLGYGIFVRDDAYANIHNNKILNIRDNPFSGCQNGVAILVGRASLGTNGSADIKDNLITGYQKNGITVSNSGSSAIVTNNVITGAGATTTIAQNGIQFSAGATGSINGNTISNHSYSPGTWTSTGMLLWGANVGTNGNTLRENQVGIYHLEGSGLHEANLLNVSTVGTQSPYFYGIIVDAPPPGLNPAPFEDELTAVATPMSTFAMLTTPIQDVDIVNNELTGDGTSAGYGIGGYAGFGALDIDLTVKNNKIANFGTGLDIYQCVGAGCTSNMFSNLDVNLNSITGSVDSGLLNTDAISVDAEQNWWGSSVAADVATGVIGDVDYTPWLCSGIDTSTDRGFQPNVSPLCPYQFTGFFQPVDTYATNSAKAGQTIPIKWRLMDANGLPISDPSSFLGITVQTGSCGTIASIDAIETYSSVSGLQYLGDGYWQFNWKTPKTYAGSCRTLRVNLDGVEAPPVYFQFK